MTSPNINILDVGTFIQIKVNMKDEMGNINPNVNVSIYYL